MTVFHYSNPWSEKLQTDFLTDKDKADIMHENIDNSKLQIVPRAGHMSTVEEPATVNRMINDFLKDL